MRESVDVLERVMRTVQSRARERAEGSYTSKLLAGGVSRIGEKIVEEAAEVVEAAGEEGPQGRAHLIHEIGDLLFHTMVMMAHRGVGWPDVAEELARREGVSGLEEKRRRGEAS